MTRHRALAERAGRRGERLAALCLMLAGWRVLARRVRTPRGEVDIVARKGSTLCFVEVKWRQNATERDLAISLHGLQRVAAAAEGLVGRFGKPGDTIRIDVILCAPWSRPRRIVNAWQPWV